MLSDTLMQLKEKERLEIENNKYYFYAIIRTLYLISQSIAKRNFLELFELFKLQDEKLKTISDSTDIIYLSPQIQNELIIIISKLVIKKLLVIYKSRECIQY